MPTKGRLIPPPERPEPVPIPEEEIGMIRTFHWTRQEQIDNADEDGTISEMEPALKAGEAPTP